MINLILLLNKYNDIILDVSFYTKDDAVTLSGIKFKVYDYYNEDNCLVLTNKNGNELVLPTDNVEYIEDEEQTWVFKHGDLEIFVIYEEKN